MGIIALPTDFGQKDRYVASIKGVILESVWSVRRGYAKVAVNQGSAWSALGGGVGDVVRVR